MGKYGITIAQDQRVNEIGTHRAEVGAGTLKDLDEAQGYALIAGNCLVTRDSNTGASGFRLSYRHPVSEALGADIRINASCAHHLTDNGKDVFPQTPNIRVAMLVEVVRMNGNILNVKPLAVHSN